MLTYKHTYLSTYTFKIVKIYSSVIDKSNTVCLLWALSAYICIYFCVHIWENFLLKNSECILQSLTMFMHLMNKYSQSCSKYSAIWVIQQPNEV